MVISFKSVKDNVVFNGMYHCEHKNGQLIYAILKAETLGNALAIANFIIARIKEKGTHPDGVN